MKVETFFKTFFWMIGVYDVLLGVGFAFCYRNIYGYFQITLPNHPGYVLVPALFLASAGIGEFLIAKNLLRNVDLAIVRLLMKLSFASVVLYYYFRYSIPAVYVLISLASVVGVIITALFIGWAIHANRKAAS